MGVYKTSHNLTVEVLFFFVVVQIDVHCDTDKVEGNKLEPE